MAFRKLKYKHVLATRSNEVLKEGELAIDGGSLYVGDGSTTGGNAISGGGGGSVTASSSTTFTNKTGNISQWTNDENYLKNVSLSSDNSTAGNITHIKGGTGITTAIDGSELIITATSPNLWSTVTGNSGTTTANSTTDTLTITGGTHTSGNNIETSISGDTLTVKAVEYVEYHDLVPGVKYRVTGTHAGNVDWTQLGAANNTQGTVFTADDTGHQGPGVVGYAELINNQYPGKVDVSVVNENTLSGDTNNPTDISAGVTDKVVFVTHTVHGSGRFVTIGDGLYAGQKFSIIQTASGGGQLHHKNYKLADGDGSQTTGATSGDTELIWSGSMWFNLKA